MFPFLNAPSDASDDNRLMRIGYGATSPLWAPFVVAAGMGVAFWMVTSWTRQGLMSGAAAWTPRQPQPAPSVDVTASAIESAPDRSPAPDGELAPAKLERVENVMMHTPPPAEAGASGPEDTAPPPPVAAEHIMDHTPPQTTAAPANPDVERKIDRAQPAEPDFLGREPGGKAALLAETSAAVLGETANFGGDLRADDAAAPDSVLEAAFEPDNADMIDAAYASNFGPVPTPGEAPPRSKKRKVAPGTAPGA